MSGKWLEILKEIAPEVRRVAFLHHPQTAAHIGFLRVIEAASSFAGVTVTAAGARDASEIEPTLTAFAETKWRCYRGTQSNYYFSTRAYH
jgi:putative ABC transport system substrate-binding protein